MTASAPRFNFVLLYVSDPLASARFYTALLGEPPIQQSPTFAMLKLSADVMLGLWLRGDVAPAVAAAPGGSEVCFGVATADAVRALHRNWSGREIAIAQPPTEMDFGHTFVALDPDGHRLRVFAPKAA
jgi:catechol 2,3-dioxygenase-like lactoylglutathione lyase family enzyme